MQAGVQPKGRLGIGGEFRIVHMRPAQAAQGQKVDFLDLWEHELNEHGVPVFKRDERGDLVPKADVEVIEERRFHNKFTRRGLSRMMHEVLKGHGGTYTAPEVTTSATTNPFAALFLASDDTVNTKFGDARPEFDESDGAFDSLISPADGVAGEGKRAVALSDTSGILKRIALSYRTTTPYGEAEFTFYAQPNSPAVETGIKGLDNFPIKSVGLAAGTACGDGEGSSFVGIRAVVGLAPTMQGICDRDYVHEGQQQGDDLIPNEYTIDESAGGATAGAAGYLQSSVQAAQQLGSDTVSAGASDTITVATRTIVLAGAAAAFPDTSGFDAATHTRMVLRISGSGVGGNNRDFTIQEVVNSTTVIVFETPAGDDNGGTNPFVGGVWRVYEGHNCFDGRVENEGRVETTDSGSVAVPADAPATVVLGEKWVSEDSAGTHTVGRVFGSTVSGLTGIRIIVPAGVNKDFVPNNFNIEVLDPTANGGNPRPGYSPDWVQVSAQTSQATTIFDAGIYGTEYTFSAVDARGVRLTAMQASSSSRKVEIAELFAFKGWVAPALSGEKLNLKVKSIDSYREFTIPDVPSPSGVGDIRDALNEVLRGYQMEAKRSVFGYLWLRSTCSGDNSELWLNAQGAENSNTDLGFPATQTNKDGITQPVTKLPGDALTIIYRVNITGNVPGGWA